jgi:hypothetical protein
MHISPGIGRHRLDRLQPEHLDHFYSDLLDEGLSAATVLRAHRIISRALKATMQRGRVHRNVATLVDPPAQRSSEAATALDEARAVLAAVTGLASATFGCTTAGCLVLAHVSEVMEWHCNQQAIQIGGDPHAQNPVRRVQT